MNINGYEISKDGLVSDNSGFSKWGFGVKAGREYFIKEFLAPIYPYGDVIKNTLSESQIERKIKECRAFENRLVKMYNVINRVSDGNVVRINEFFRCNSKYYIVTDRVKNSGMTVEQIARLPYECKKFICKIVAHAVLGLHDEGFIHADIKPNNILICADRKNNKYTAKIIDFDCGFFGTEPPEPGTELNGDPIYFAPEVLMHMMEEEVALSCKIDVFSLGVLFHQYMTGKQPIYDTNNYDYVTEAILDEAPVSMDPSIPAEFASIIHRMLIKNPYERISLQEVYDKITVNPKIFTGEAVPAAEHHDEGSPNIIIYRGNRS